MKGYHHFLLAFLLIMLLVAGWGPAYAAELIGMPVNKQIKITRSVLKGNRSTSTYESRITLKNRSAQTIYGPLALVVLQMRQIITVPDPLAPGAELIVNRSNLALSNASGQTPQALPYLSIQAPPDGLAPGQKIKNIVLRFKKPSGGTLTKQSFSIIPSLTGNNPFREKFKASYEIHGFMTPTSPPTSPPTSTPTPITGSGGETSSSAVLVPVTVLKSGSGIGRVYSEIYDSIGAAVKSGIDCSSYCPKMAGIFNYDPSDSAPNSNRVTLTAIPDPDFIFTGWSGAETCASQTNAPDGGKGVCLIAMDGKPKQITANFSAKPTLTIDATTGSTGTGTVVSDPHGIACNTGAVENCESAFLPNDKVTLTAKPDTGFFFAGWFGPDADHCPQAPRDGGQGTCVIAMDGKPKEIVADFEMGTTLTIIVRSVNPP